MSRRQHLGLKALERFPSLYLGFRRDLMYDASTTKKALNTCHHCLESDAFLYGLTYITFLLLRQESRHGPPFDAFLHEVYVANFRRRHRMEGINDVYLRHQNNNSFVPRIASKVI
ncbi:hypothetical protein Salat_2412100 [Sesamum alatum]|uniref:Uncharacterized protein n=1 Tax=Sesamum alatum TaxID=300844 RepID=A0AAE1XXY7_9LAMI|nr:hypothetical protein Salat_2412100 [Sesamum alatum]